jgi:hypothetical protein
MVFTTNNVSNIIVYNSITNTLNDEKFDNVNPFSFIEFLNYTKSLDRSIVEFSDYQLYLKKWNEVTLTRYNDINLVIRQEFINFLKTIALNYTTSEEKRYLENINYESNEDLEIAIPFFSTKIKQVLLYFAEKRDTYKIDLELVKNKGSINGVTTYLKNTIIETIFGNDLTPQITPTQPLSTVSNNLSIEIDNGYDIFNDYFDLDPFVPPSFYNALGDRKKYFTSNTNVIDSNIFLNYDQAIIDLINSERVVLEELQSLVVNINTPNINLLQDYDFIDYNNRDRSNIKLILNAELIKKFTGTDFYYLSTTSAGVVLSGLLFEATSPFANLLNIHTPSTLTVPQSSNLFERDVGLFFKPNTFSILQLQTPFTFSLKDTIEQDKVYIFPNPYEYGNVTGVGKVDYDTPFLFVQNGFEIQKNISSNNALGNSFVTKNDFTFESYHSKEQNSSKSFLQLLVNNGVVTNYVSDIFGNVYFGLKLKNTDYLKNFYKNVTLTYSPFGLSAFTQVPYLSSIKEIVNNGTFNDTNSVTQSILNTLPNPSIYYTRNTPGNFYIYNILSDTVQPLSSEFSNIISKFPNQQNELNNKLLSFEVFGNTFVATTSAFVVIDKFNYTDGLLEQSFNVPLTLNSVINNKASNVYKVNDELFITTINVTTNPTLTSNNSRPYTISFYSYNLNNNKTTTYYFDTSASNNLSYIINSLINVTNVNLIFNERQQLFNVVITFKDLNNNIFLHNLFYRLANGVFSLIKNNFYYPGNTNLTINFYDGANTGQLSTQTLLTTPIQDSTNGTITF